MPDPLKAKPWIFITDLDGTLLDQKTYRYELSLPAVDELREREIPLILCSSKTAAEIIRLRGELGLKDPFICENGGAIYLPRGYFHFPILGTKPKQNFEVIEFGTDVYRLRRALRQVSRRGHISVRSFGTMTFHEIMARTGLTKDQAVYARQREYDEPFLVDAGDEATLLAALREKGLTVIQGDRFHHLTGGHGKGEAVRKLLELYRRQRRPLSAVALGNSANDLAMLREAERAVVVRNPDGTWDAELMKELPGALRTDAIGPKGWREAVEKFLPEVSRLTDH
jgi:mannosyl-3-phosphoglycerate phosphatase family protein